MSFDAELDADLDAQLAAEPDFAYVHVTVNGKYRKLRFTQMDGLAWADLCDRCPPRMTQGPNKTLVPIELDGAYGYNVRSVTALAAPISGHVQSGDDWVELSEERWRKLIKGLPGAQLRACGDAIFQLNQWGPSQAVLDAKKASEVESAMKSFSPALSESPEVV